MIELNKVYIEDNISLIKRIDNDSVDLIYCDILYNTGRVFTDYSDNLGDDEAVIEFYTERFTEMRRIMKPTGSIYIHCDYRINYLIRVLMNKIFGKNNFQNELIWCFRSAGFSKTKFSNKHNTIYYYTKSNKYTFNLNDVREDEISESTLKRFGKEIEQNGFIKNVKNGKTYEINPYSPPRSWFVINAVPQELNKYDTQKPELLLKKIILASSNEGDTVCDFFNGSGTTCLVAHKLKRNFIGCDINVKSKILTQQRFTDNNIALTL